MVAAVLLAAVAVGWAAFPRGPQQPRVVAASCHWAGASVRVTATVYNPNATPQDVVLKPTYRLTTGGVQAAHITATVWTGSLPGGLMAGHATARRTVYTAPDARPWHAGEPIAACTPTASIPAHRDD